MALVHNDTLAIMRAHTLMDRLSTEQQSKTPGTRRMWNYLLRTIWFYQATIWFTHFTSSKCKFAFKLHLNLGFVLESVLKGKRLP